MCFLLYMASDRNRPEIAWDAAAPRFHVRAHDPGVPRVRPRFTKPHVVYLGSSESCGCGFRQEHDREFGPDDPERRAVTEDNQRQLHAWVRECLADEPEVELFGCWAGDEAEEAVGHRLLGVDELVSDAFVFVEGEVLTVRSDPPPRPAPPPG